MSEFQFPELPVDIADTYADRSASDRIHQEHHDAIHQAFADYNAAGVGGSSGGGAWYGDGSDGDVTISVNTTLTRDMYYDDLTVTAGFVLRTAGFRVFVRGLLTLDGTIMNDGFGNVFNSSSTAAANGGTLPGGGTAGASGGTGAGASTSATSDCIGGQGGSGGAGSSGAGGTAGAVTSPIETRGGTGLPRTPLGAYVMGYLSPTGGFFGTALKGGTGGGAGAGDGTNSGGGGGGGGGACVVFAREVTGSGTISAQGGTGKAPSAGNCGGGGGGGGGAAVLVTGSTSHTLTLTAAGGAGGAKTGTGVAGVAGSAGRTYQLLGV